MERTTGRLGIAALTASAVLLVGCGPTEDDPAATDGTATGGTATGAPSRSAPDGTSDAPAEQRIARAIFDRVNAERAERGLAELAWNDTLAGIAAGWSQEMSANDRLEHQDVAALMEREELSGFRGIGENIFTATAPVPAGMIHVGWMESENHRVNVLNPGWNRVGIGVHCAEDGSVWATQEFGRTVDADVPAVAEEVPPEQPIVRAEEDGPSCS